MAATAASIHNGPQEPMLPPPSTSMSQKRGKTKKEKVGADETSKLLAAKISQLEQDAAGEKDQEAEIGMSAACQSIAAAQGFSCCCSRLD